MSAESPADPTTDALGDVAPTTFSDGFHADAARLVRRYPVARSALLPLLHLVQSEHGYVSRAGIAECARLLDLTKAEVGAVATFYTMYKREPVGDYLLSVCTNPTCQVAGSQVIFDRYKEALGGVRDPETKVSIEQAECLGICDAAPVVQVNYDMYGPLTDEEADRLLAGCREGTPPASSWSGEPAPTFAEVERELSGANDAFGDALVEAARHSITGYDVPPSYKTGETDIPVTHPGGDRAGHGGEIFATGFAGRNGDAPAGDPETAERADDQSVTPDQADEVDDVAAAAEDQAAEQGGDREQGDENVDVADEAEQAADEPGEGAGADGAIEGDGTDDAVGGAGGTAADQPGADPRSSTDQPAAHASPGTGDDETSPDEVDSVAEPGAGAGHDAPAPDQNEAGGA